MDKIAKIVQEAGLPPDPVSRREYLTISAVNAGASIWLAMEAVASAAIEHPGWDMDEMKPWDEWVNP